MPHGDIIGLDVVVQNSKMVSVCVGGGRGNGKLYKSWPNSVIKTASMIYINCSILHNTHIGIIQVLSHGSTTVFLAATDYLNLWFQ